MARTIKSATITLKWEDGRECEIGTLQLEGNTDGLSYTVKHRVRMQRIGWEFVRLGTRLMFPGRKWKETYK